MRRTPVVAATIGVLTAAARDAARTGPRAPGGTGSSDPVGTARTHYHRPCSDQSARTEDARRQARSDRSLGGGGSDADIEREGGLKPGELPLLPWARELRAKREKATYEEPCIYCLPMSVPRVNPYPWKFSMSHVEGADADLRAARDRRCRRTPRRVHGWPETSCRSVPDVVGSLNRVVERRHARHRYGRLQRQVLVRRARHTAHRAAAHDRAMDARQ